MHQAIVLLLGSLPLFLASPLPQTTDPSTTTSCTTDSECSTGYCYQQSCTEVGSITGLPSGEHCVQESNCDTSNTCDASTLTCTAIPTTGGTGPIGGTGTGDGSPPSEPTTPTACTQDFDCSTSYCFKSQCEDPSTFARGAAQGEHCLNALACEIPAVGPSFTCECSGTIGRSCNTDFLVCTELKPATREEGQYCTEDFHCKSQKCDTTIATCLAASPDTGIGSVPNGRPCGTDNECASGYCFETVCDNPVDKTPTAGQHCFIDTSGKSNCDSSTTCSSISLTCEATSTPGDKLGAGSPCTTSSQCKDNWCREGVCEDPNATFYFSGQTCFIFPEGSPSKDNCYPGTTAVPSFVCDSSSLTCVGGGLGQGCSDDWQCDSYYCLKDVCTNPDPRTTSNLGSGEHCAVSPNCQSGICDVSSKKCIGSDPFPWALGHSCGDSIECDQSSGSVLCTNGVCAKPATGPKANDQPCSVGSDCNSGYCNPDKVCESYASRPLGASCKAREQCETWNCDSVCFIPTKIITIPGPGGDKKEPVQVIVPAITVNVGGTQREISPPGITLPGAVRGTQAGDVLSSTGTSRTNTTTSRTGTSSTTTSSASSSYMVAGTLLEGLVVAVALVCFT